MGLTLKIDPVGRISIKGKKIKLDNLNATQAQNVLLTLNCEPDALFEALWSFEEHGLNETDLGLTGSFMFAEFKGVNQ